ncbi:hypothetical protein IX317_001639 [Fusobacterium sp. DD29]|nr:hypothetical protein [Fusobacterium sp. DD45]MBR8711927.1 hypothetical protein [Fusobacterium sp. DD28]MBR8749959.1 hypothetical protein [Fusobacterium sp. DD29]MBR8752500.1 hypothetical protein [Fusobacterium sp. DD26]MBR8762228.1 hypothetical protein [Fusobacterium sp. DD25]MBR8768218.1 hypothetical protein [Fusobacterium sp. DD43]MBR8772294.1 hypothetical protein [Fusobacterium sp. DD40]MBR8776513.1 hypothetical protein [Fusobacterium sp. DD17]MBR8798776.1 hypothetical protein [Fusoba
MKIKKLDGYEYMEVTLFEYIKLKILRWLT